MSFPFWGLLLSLTYLDRRSISKLGPSCCPPPVLSAPVAPRQPYPQATAANPKCRPRPLSGALGDGVTQHVLTPLVTWCQIGQEITGS